MNLIVKMAMVFYTILLFACYNSITASPVQNSDISKGSFFISDSVNVQGIWDFCDWPVPERLSKITPKFIVKVRGNERTFIVSSNDKIRSMIKELMEEGLIKDRALFLIHGYMSTFPWDKTMSKMADALLQAEDSTVFIVAWEKGAININFAQAASNTQTVAAAMAFAVKSLKESKSIYSYCIGHSLGAHTCGQAGQIIKFDRITGLDPAGPGFQNCPQHIGLSNTSADCVDVIHTTSYSGTFGFGILKPLGHVDFYPNCGQVQPGCYSWDYGCSHVRVVDYYMESITAFASDKPDCPASQGPCNENFLRSCKPCGWGGCQKFQKDCKNEPQITQAIGYGSVCHNKEKPTCKTPSSPQDYFGIWFVPMTTKGFDQFCEKF